MIKIDYKKAKAFDFYVNPNVTSHGTLPPFLSKSFSWIKPQIYDGKRPRWHPSTERMRRFLMEEVWGANYSSRSSQWVIGHTGSPLSQESIQIDHIIKWETISKYLLNEYAGENAKGTPWEHRTPLNDPNGELVKGVDYVDDPFILANHGEDILYRFTNIAAIKFFHTIENLRPLSGSINAKRNTETIEDDELGIIHPERVDIDLMEKLAELSSRCEEYIIQVVNEVDSSIEKDYREALANKFLDTTDEIIKSLEQGYQHLFL